MTRSIVLTVAVVATIGAVLLAQLSDHGGHAESPPADDDLAVVTDPRVTQDNIQHTICRRTWTRSVRPPRDAIEAIKRNLAADVHVNTRDYELDHIVPLDLGGAALDLRNLMLQPRAGACNAHHKDALERRLRIMVCAGDLTLNGAQHEIATDWRAAYKKWINGKGCETP
jgi:5-methylcytosine-specific restriction endonuclease McrA